MKIIFGDNLYYNLLFFIIVSILFTWFFTQAFKVFLKCWIGKKFSFKLFFQDGDFPSTHTAVVTTSVILILFLNALTLGLTDENEISAYTSAKDFLIMFTLASIVIRDAMGQRHRQDNTNSNLKKLKDYITEENVIEHIDLTFESIDNEAFKRVGHLKHEVYGGMIIGALCALYPIIIFFERYDWTGVAVVGTLTYIVTVITFLKVKPVVVRKITRYRKNKDKEV